MVQVPNLPASNPFSYKSLTNKMGRNIKTIKNKAVSRINSGYRSPSPISGSRPQTPVSRPSSATGNRCCPCPAFKKGGRTRRRSRR
jgi:hypothetical protein